MKLKLLFTSLLVGCAMFSLGQSVESDFDSNGVKIHYYTEGTGEAVVLIHGWMGDSSTWGHDAAGNTKLTTIEGFEAIALDCRGHGKSGKPYDPNKYGVEMAEDVVRLLDHLKIKKAHLLGYSMGSFIAGNVAARHPERVLSIIYGGQGPLIKGAPSTGGSKEVEIFAKAVEDGKGLGPYLIAVMPPTWGKLTLDQANAIAKLTYANKDVKAFAVSGLTLGKLEVAAKDLRKCKAPSLFIYGGNESHFVTDNIAAARKVVPTSEVKVIEGGDHISTLAKPEFGLAVVEFLKAHKSKN
jgi:pimeloyl-ACP methyl ester carboxylesterase